MLARQKTYKNNHAVFALYEQQLFGTNFLFSNTNNTYSIICLAYFSSNLYMYVALMMLPDGGFAGIPRRSAIFFYRTYLLVSPILNFIHHA
jgi:hypothetical protein